MSSIIVVALVLGSISFAHAQVNSVRANIQNQRIEAQQIKTTIQENRKDLQNTVTATRANIQNQIQVQKTDIQERLENATTAEERKSILMEAKETRDIVKAENSETRSDFRKQSNALLDQRMDLIIKKFKAYIERGYSVAERINSRLDELSETEVDVSTEKEMYTKAKDLLSQANTKADEAYIIYGIIDMTLERSQIQEELKKVKELLGEARISLREAYQILRDVVKNLKEQRPTVQETVAR